MVHHSENKKNLNINNQVNSLEETNLGNETTLLSSVPLGQSFLSPKFIYPQGSKVFNFIDLSFGSGNDNHLQGFYEKELWEDSSLDNSTLENRENTSTESKTNPETFAEVPPPSLSDSIEIQPKDTKLNSIETPLKKTNTVQRQKANNYKSHFFQKKVESAREKKSHSNNIHSPEKSISIPEIQTTAEALINPENPANQPEFDFTYINNSRTNLTGNSDETRVNRSANHQGNTNKSPEFDSPFINSSSNNFTENQDNTRVSRSSNHQENISNSSESNSSFIPNPSTKFTEKSDNTRVNRSANHQKNNSNSAKVDSPFITNSNTNLTVNPDDNIVHRSANHQENITNSSEFDSSLIPNSSNNLTENLDNNIVNRSANHQENITNSSEFDSASIYNESSNLTENLDNNTVSRSSNHRENISKSPEFDSSLIPNSSTNLTENPDNNIVSRSANYQENITNSSEFNSASIANASSNLTENTNNNIVSKNANHQGNITNSSEFDSASIVNASSNLTENLDNNIVNRSANHQENTTNSSEFNSASTPYSSSNFTENINNNIVNKSSNHQESISNSPEFDSSLIPNSSSNFTENINNKIVNRSASHQENITNSSEFDSASLPHLSSNFTENINNKIVNRSANHQENITNSSEFDSASLPHLSSNFTENINNKIVNRSANHQENITNSSEFNSASTPYSSSNFTENINNKIVNRSANQQESISNSPEFDSSLIPNSSSNFTENLDNKIVNRSASHQENTTNSSEFDSASLSHSSSNFTENLDNNIVSRSASHQGKTTNSLEFNSASLPHSSNNLTENLDNNIVNRSAIHQENITNSSEFDLASIPNASNNLTENLDNTIINRSANHQENISNSPEFDSSLINNSNTNLTEKIDKSIINQNINNDDNNYTSLSKPNKTLIQKMGEIYGNLKSSFNDDKERNYTSRQELSGASDTFDTQNNSVVQTQNIESPPEIIQTRSHKNKTFFSNKFIKSNQPKNKSNVNQVVANQSVQKSSLLEGETNQNIMSVEQQKNVEPVAQNSPIIQRSQPEAFFSDSPNNIAPIDPTSSTTDENLLAQKSIEEAETTEANSITQRQEIPKIDLPTKSLPIEFSENVDTGSQFFSQPQISEPKSNFSNKIVLPNSITPTTKVTQRKIELSQPVESSTQESLLSNITSEPNIVQKRSPSLSADSDSTLKTEDRSQLTELSTSNSQTVAQMLAETGEIPLIPTVLQKLTPQNIINRSKLSSNTPLVESEQFSQLNNQQNNTPNTIAAKFNSLDNELNLKLDNKTPLQVPKIQQQRQLNETANVPNSWSSIEELLGETSGQKTESSLVQTFATNEQEMDAESSQEQQSSDIRSSMLLPPGVSMGVNGPKSLGLLEQPSSLQQLMQTSLQASVEIKEATATRQGESLQPIKAEDLMSFISATPQNESAQKQEEKEENTDRIEELAREIYCLIRQRLEVERERHGDYYSGRLLW